MRLIERVARHPRAAGTPTSISPCGSTVGMSFDECTARSIGPADQRLLDLLGEQALAAGLGQRPVLDAVAGGRITSISINAGVEPVRRGQRRAHHMRLRQRERAAARAEPQDCCTEDCVTGPRSGSRCLNQEAPCLYSESRRHATRPRPPWSSGHDDGPGKILSNVVLSQVNEHAAFGGVVPEIAARAHVEALDRIIAQGDGRTPARPSPSIDGVAAAAGPGLIGGVIVGLTTAKAIALVNDKPLIAVNHLEAHALTARLTDARRRFPIACSWPPAATPRSSRCAASAITCGSAPPSTTPSARPSTRPRSCWASAIPAGRRSRRKPLRGNPLRFALPRPMHGRAGAGFLAVRA